MTRGSADQEYSNNRGEWKSSKYTSSSLFSQLTTLFRKVLGILILLITLYFSTLYLMNSHIRLLSLSLKSIPKPGINTIIGVFSLLMLGGFLLLWLPVPGTRDRLFLQPLKLQWKTVVSRKLVNVQTIPITLTNLVQKRNNFHWITTVDIHKNSIIISVIQIRVLLPVRPKYLDRQLHNLLRGHKITSRRIDTPSLNNQTVRFITTDHIEKTLAKLSTQLFELELNNKVITAIHPHAGEDTFRVSLLIASRNLGEIRLLMRGVGKYAQIRRPILPVTISTLPHRHSMEADRYSAYKLVRLPSFTNQQDHVISTYNAPIYRYKPSFVLGTIMNYGVAAQSFGLPISDLKQGGLITGAIGTGKTTLRLHLLMYAIINEIRIIDFDIKGDTARYEFFHQHCKVVTPKRDFYLNPFLLPQGYSTSEYTDILQQNFVETIPQGEELSPQQLQLLSASIDKTVREEGNCRDFFANLFHIAEEQQNIIDNKQYNSAIALKMRFNWMQGSLRDIFWHNTSSLLYTDYQETSLVFDLSLLHKSATATQTRFLINLIMARFMATLPDQPQSELQHIISIDEAQLLMPQNKGSMSKLEQAVTTLRYKGISILATGVSADMMSTTLRDVSLIVQFRTTSMSTLRVFGEKDFGKILPKLPRFTAVFRGNSLGNSHQIVRTKDFTETEVTEKYLESKIEAELPSFELSFVELWSSKIDILVGDAYQVPRRYRSVLHTEAKSFIKRAITQFEWKDNILNMYVRLLEHQFKKMDQDSMLPLVATRYPHDFKVSLIRNLILEFFISQQHNPKLKAMIRQLPLIVKRLLKAMEINPQAPMSEKEEPYRVLRDYINRHTTGIRLDVAERDSFVLRTGNLLRDELEHFQSAEQENFPILIEKINEMGLVTEDEKVHLGLFHNEIMSRIVDNGGMVVEEDLKVTVEVGKVILKLYSRRMEMTYQTTPVYEVSRGSEERE